MTGIFPVKVEPPNRKMRRDFASIRSASRSMADFSGARTYRTRHGGSARAWISRLKEAK